MSRFIEGEQRTQSVLFSEQLEDWIAEENPVRTVDAFVDEPDLSELGIGGVQPAATGRPACHAAALLKIHIHGYLNRIQSSRRLERGAQRNVELIWLTGRLMPDLETIPLPCRGASDLANDDSRARTDVDRYWRFACPRCPVKSQCAPADCRHITPRRLCAGRCLNPGRATAFQASGGGARPSPGTSGASS